MTPHTPPHVVICGYPRAGTTLLYLMLRACTVSIDGHKPVHMPPRECSADDGRIATVTTAKVTKRPLDVFKVAKLDREPGIKFVFCIRDPRDVLTSVHAAAPGQYKIGWDSAVATRRGRPVHGATTPGLFARHKALVDAVGKHCSLSPCLIVRYETLVADPDQVQAALAAQLGFGFVGSFQDFHKHHVPERLALPLGPTRPVDTAGVGRWRGHAERIKDQFAHCPDLHNAVWHWGYEPEGNIKWITRL